MKETQTACQAWWVEKDLFLPTFSYERITLHDPAFCIAMLTNSGREWIKYNGVAYSISGKNKAGKSPAASGSLAAKQ